jgi:hypothetical protein
VADYLLIAIFSYFGDNTKKNVRIDIAEDNEKVQRLRSAFDAILPSSLAPLFNSSSGEVLIEKSILEDKERCLRYSWKL